jgi:hypothetical protein
MSGSNSVSSQGIYTTLGGPGLPGGRESGVLWMDTSLNVWVFGGDGYDSGDHFGLLNDLWMY